jgi:hypothetical protein
LAGWAALKGDRLDQLEKLTGYPPSAVTPLERPTAVDPELFKRLPLYRPQFDGPVHAVLRSTEPVGGIVRLGYEGGGLLSIQWDRFRVTRRKRPER